MFGLEALANLRFSKGTGRLVHVVSEMSPDGLGTTLGILRH